MLESIVLRPDQQAGLDDAVDFIKANREKPARRLYSSPTGSGKSYIILSLQRELHDEFGIGAYIVTPKPAIVYDMLEKIGYKIKDDEGNLISKAKLDALAWENGIVTPVKLRNALLESRCPIPHALIIDESHHGIADTYEILSACVGSIPWVGYTATPYRGTPQGTAELWQKWGGGYYTLLSFTDAMKQGITAMPSIEMRPLVDSDKIEIVNGEIRVAAATAAYQSKLDAVADIVRPFFTKSKYANGYYDKPTMIAVPGTETAKELTNRLNLAGLPAECVTQETNDRDRKRIFDETIMCRKVLVQIDVVSEGVDLPLRRLIDCKPTLSPVRFMQQLGRITRPLFTPDPSQTAEYICTCRNLEVHAYLLEGLAPRSVIKTAQEAFGGPSIRANARYFGLQAIGRFKPLTLHLDGGIKGTMYALYTIENASLREYCILIRPDDMKPVIATRSSKIESTDGGEYGNAREYKYGKWKRIDQMPSDFTGFQTSKFKGTLRKKQRDWWTQAARAKGLDADVVEKVTGREFQALPVLCDIGVRL